MTRGVVFQVNEAATDKQRTALRNIRNLIADMPELTVEVVAHGDGIGLSLSDSPLAEEVAKLLDRGVKVAACQNTMASHNIPDQALLPQVIKVPAGIAEIVRRQLEGYAYVKP